jgi:hypothetical protein
MMFSIIFWDEWPYSTVIDNVYGLFYYVTFEVNVFHNKIIYAKKRYAFYLSLKNYYVSLHLWRNLRSAHYVAPKHTGVQLRYIEFVFTMYIRLSLSKIHFKIVHPCFLLYVGNISQY